MNVQELCGKYIDQVGYSAGSKLLLLVSKKEGNFVVAGKNEPMKYRGYVLIHKIQGVHLLKKATIKSIKYKKGDHKVYGTTPFNFTEAHIKTDKGTCCIFVGLSHAAEHEYPELCFTEICRKDDLDIEEADDGICLLPGGYSLEDEDHG